MKLQIRDAHDQLILSTFRFVGRHSDDTLSKGTGFVARHHVPSKGPEYFLVTNRHVANGAVEASCQFAQARGQLPHSCWLEGSFEIDASPSERGGWFCHDSADVAVYRLPPGQTVNEKVAASYDFAVIPTERFAGANPDARLGEEISIIGYPFGLIDRSSAPLFRKGTVASPPSLDWQDERTFLIDASIFPGSSGSPVYVSDIGKGVTVRGNELTLLGLVSSVMSYDAEGELVALKVPASKEATVSFKNSLHLGVVTKAQCVIETMDAVLAGKARRL